MDSVVDVKPSVASVDVKPSVARVELEDSESPKVVEAMPKRPSEIAEELLRIQTEKYALLEKSLTGNVRDTVSPVELDQQNRTFFETLLPTLRKVKSEEILLCRNEVSRIIYQYAYKNSNWVSIDSSKAADSPPSTSTRSNRKRQRLTATMTKTDSDDGKNNITID